MPISGWKIEPWPHLQALPPCTSEPQTSAPASILLSGRNYICSNDHVSCLTLWLHFVVHFSFNLKLTLRKLMVALKYDLMEKLKKFVYKN